MKLKRRDFLKSIVPAIWGGKKVVEDLLQGPGEDSEEDEVVQVDTPTCFSASTWPGWDPDPRYAPVIDGTHIRLEVDDLSGSPRWVKYIDGIGWRRML